MYAVQFGYRGNFDEVKKLESDSFPEDEQLTNKQIQYQLDNFHDLFLGLYKVDGEPMKNDLVVRDDLERNKKASLVGFVLAGLSEEKLATKSSMGNGTKQGKTLCLHSVIVGEDHRRKGLGRKMMRFFVDNVKKRAGWVERMALISKDHLIAFYNRFGFEVVGMSNADLGEDQWYDMVLKVNKTVRKKEDVILF